MPGIYVVLKALFNMKSGLVGKSQVRHGDALSIFEHQLSGEKKRELKTYVDTRGYQACHIYRMYWIDHQNTCGFCQWQPWEGRLTNLKQYHINLLLQS